MEKKELNGYLAFYSGQRIEIYAETLWKAKEEAVKKFKVPKSKHHMVSIVLAEKGGEPVVHSTAEIG